MKKTQQALRPIHCGSHLFIPERENVKAVNDGLWTTLINSATEGEMKEYIEHSTKCMELVLPKILENKVNDYEKARKIKFTICVFCMKMDFLGRENIQVFEIAQT